MTRITSRTMLGLALAFAAGCGGSSTPEAAKAPVPLDPGPASVPGPNTSTQTPPPEGKPPPQTPAPTPPAAPAVAGELAGQPFTAVVEFQTDTLYLRSAKEADPRSVEVKLTAEQLKKLDGLKVAVGKNDVSGPGVPHVMTYVPGRTPNELKSFEGGYDLTLEFGPKAGGKRPGSIALTLPGDEKTRLTGSFTAAITRPPTEPPGADDAPFVQGKVAVTGWDGDVKVGYLLLGPHDPPVVDSVFLGFDKPGTSITTATSRPWATTLVAGGKDAPGRYEHTHLPPGRYFVFAQAVMKPGGGPVVWKWVDVPANGQVAADFTLDAGKFGGLEVAVPAGSAGPVQLTPAPEEGKPWDETTAATAAVILDLQAEPKADKAAFARLAPGKYEVRANGLNTATVEVKPGEAAKVELKK